MCDLHFHGFCCFVGIWGQHIKSHIKSTTIAHQTNQNIPQKHKSNHTKYQTQITSNIQIMCDISILAVHDPNHTNPKHKQMTTNQNVCVFDIWVCLLCCCVQTPLHWAAFYGFDDCLSLLLEHGADLALEDVCCVMCDILG